MKYILVYDADCGPCTRFKRLIDFLDSRQKFGFMSLVQADTEGFLDEIASPLRHRSFHLVSPDGVVLSGAKAIPALIGLLPAGKAASELMISAPGGMRGVGFVYSAFSRLHDSGSCHYRPGSGSPVSGKTRNITGEFPIPQGRNGTPLALS